MTAIVKWMVVLLLISVVVGGGGAYWCLSQSDDILKAEVLKQLRQIGPDLAWNIERAHFDFTGRIRLHGLAITLPDSHEPACYVPESIVTLDDQSLTDFEKVSIRRLRLVHPQWTVVRRPDGSWNWQGHRWQLRGGQPVPEVEIEHGSVTLALQRPDGQALPLKLDDVNLSAIPSAAKKLKAVLTTRIEPAGPLTATADLNLEGAPFNLEARWLKIPIDDDLLDLVAEFSPSLQDRLDAAREKLSALASTQSASSSLDRPTTDGGRATAPMQLESTLTPVENRPAPFGLKCLCDVRGRLSWDSLSGLKYQVLADIRSGQLSHVVLPLPLYELRGSLYVEPGQILVRNLRALNGATTLLVNSQVAAGSVPEVNLEIRKLTIDEPLKARLPEQVRRLIHSLALTGTCDVDARSVDSQGVLTWDGDLRLVGGSLSYDKFEYPVHHVEGTARVRGKRIELEGKGRAAGIPVTMAGWIVNPGPANACQFDIRADRVPLNEDLRRACPEAMQKALIELDLQGSHDLRLLIAKEAGLGQRYRLVSSARLRDCSCRLKSFPYRIHSLQGRIDSHDDLVTFRDLTGMHDQTLVTASGTFLKAPLPGRLALTIHAENAAFDRSLETALPPNLATVWREFQPSGRFDVDADIQWTPGQACTIQFPRIRIADGEITLRSFPWPLRGIQGEFSYETLAASTGLGSGAARLQIKSVSASHDDTRLRGRGDAIFAANEPWRVRFDELHVDDLIPNSTFRRALPPTLRQAFDSLSPTGKYSVGTNGGTVELRSDGPSGVAATWDIQLLLTDCAVNAGIRIDAIHGRVDLKGACNMRSTTLSGRLDLDSVSVFRQTSGMAYQVTKVVGPFSLQDGIFVGGAAVVASPAPPIRQPQLSERISGELFDGTATLDVVADLRKDPDYRMQITLTRGRLETYARQYLRGQSNLAGVINGWLFLWGRGTAQDQLHGRGELQIAPAALYELPIFVQIFQSLRLDAVDKTAFDRADVRYNIENSRFNFEAIHLMGKAISLHGRGFVRFDGVMQLDFYSMLARRQIGIPVVQELAGMITRGWVGVKVTGSVGAPDTRVIAVPEFDEALKQFLGSFDPNTRPPSGKPNAGRPVTIQ